MLTLIALNMCIILVARCSISPSQISQPEQFRVREPLMLLPRTVVPTYPSSYCCPNLPHFRCSNQPPLSYLSLPHLLCGATPSTPAVVLIIVMKEDIRSLAKCHFCVHGPRVCPIWGD